jgi:hypothetical protein
MSSLNDKQILKFSTKRILKDYLDIQRNPLETVKAEPLPETRKKNKISKKSL